MPNPVTKLFLLLLFGVFFTPFAGLGQISKPQWVDDIGGSDANSIPSAVKIDKQNNVYVTGLFSGTVDFDPTPTGVYNLSTAGGINDFDIYVAKYTPAGKLIWAKSMGGGGIDQVNSMTIDNNGNPTISGQYDSNFMDADPGNGVFTLTNNGDKDEFIIQLTTNGAFSWAKSIGGGATDYGGKIVADSQGNVVGVSQFQGSVTVGGQTYSAPGGFSGMAVKFSPTGNPVWVLNLADAVNSEAHNCAIDANDNVIVSGVFSSTVNFNPLGTPYNINANGASTFIAKYNKNGILIWVKTIAGSVTSNNTNLCVNSKNEIYIDGPFSSPLIFNTGISLSPQGQRDIFLAKFSAAGDLLAANDVGGTYAHIYNYGIVASKNDDIYLSGYFDGTIDFDPSSTSVAPVSYHGNQDLFLAKYDSDLNYKWAFSAGSPNCSNTLGRNVEIDNNNDVLLVGSFCSTVDFDATTCSDLMLTAKSTARDSFVGKYVQSTATANLKITAFSIPGQSIPAVIDQSKLLITVTVPAGTDVKALKPNITVPGGVTLSPASAVAENFTDPVSYKLTGNNCNSLNYTVKVVFATNTVNTKSICSGAATVLVGNVVAPVPGSYVWQINNNNSWVNAPGTINNKDYATSALTNNTALNIVYSLRRQTNTGGTIAYDSYYDVTVQPAAAISNNVVTAPAVATFCSSADAAVITGSTPAGGNGTYTYQWQKSADNTTFTDITGATAKNYDPPATNITTYYRRIVTSGTCTLPVTGTAVIIKVEPVLAANSITAPAVNLFCSATDAAIITGSTPTGGDGIYTYQWQSSADNITFTAINGATAKDYDPPLVSVTTYFRRLVVSGVCTAPLASNITSIQIQGTTPVINNLITAPAAVTFCVSGDPAVIAGNVPSGGTGAFTYQWQSSANNITFIDIAGATGQSYDPGPVNTDTYYRRIASSGSCVLPVVSNVAGVKMLPAIAGNTIAAPAITTFCANGDPAPITGSVPTGGDGTYSYQWQKSTDNISFTDISGAVGKNYDPGVITATTYYRRLVTSGSCIMPLAGNTVIVTVETAIAGNNITAPAVTSFCITGDASTITGRNPTGGNGVFKYQWQISTDNTVFKDIQGATLRDYDPAPVNVNTYYRRKALSGSCITPSISNVVRIIILAVPATPVFAGTPPVICPGASATIVISAPQTGIIYNWYSSSAKDNLLFSGTSFPTGTLNTATSYYVEASNGICSSALAPIQVSMAPIPTAPALVENPVRVCAGLTATLKIQNPQTGFTYNWYSNATTGVLLYTGISFTTPVLTGGATYYAEAVNAAGCASGTRTAVNVNTIALPQIAVNNTAICPGTTATLTVSSSDGDNTILWYTSASAITPVYTGNSFTTPSLNSSTSYYVGAVNAGNCGTIVRTKVDVTMLKQLDAPVVSVDATTNSSIAFKWNAVEGATGYQVSIDNGQTYSQPSSGSNGLSHTVSGLQFNEQVTILVQALGASSCQLSGSSTAVTGTAISPNGSQIYVANTFTPNGDGNNDIVYVHGEGIKSIAFYVYDQWGELIFTSADMGKGWDGYYKGTREPVGVYVYYVKAVTNSGLQLNKKGTITLLR
ncbi:Ig-like domain-containing protein [Mucilaginibacter sp. SJ]|uniref:Ig-like domain-containing protein n=1 Tax=Mucilaginibacter sp. SJ TaxID=3029053 RepID=UPI0023A9BA08|nr:gliding motility-associated C-terminal domain-containing protein [Mucilaginibacter sp. SJ]WDZ99208.1 gliding motility-associated C-terminal domain-containing protein [Mucilaginibacter sp. SJ]